MSKERAERVIELLDSGIISSDDAWNLIELMDNNLYYNLSQDEIDSIVKELKEIYDPPVVIKVNPSGEIDCSGTIGTRKASDAPEVKSICVFHEWVWYTGLNETFEYCKICGEKKK